MSDTPDFGGDTTLDFSSEIAAPAVDSAPVDESQVNWEERYRSEVQDRIKERERYKPIRQVFDQMHPDDAQAVQQFAQSFASGDQEAAIKWMVDNAKALAGDNFNSYIGQQQQVVDNALAQGQAAGLTPDQVSQLVSQQLQAHQHEQQVQQFQIEIDQTLRELGLEPESALATVAIVAANNRPDLDLRAAYQEMENQILQQAQSIVEKRRGAAGSMPTAGPNGFAGVPSTSATPREKAMARLEQNGV